MIRLSVFYPSGEGSTFDHDYYRDTHVPMAVQTWAGVTAQIDRGLNGPNVAAAHFLFESTDAMDAAMGSPGTAELMADVPNFTNIAPVSQISETAV
jgi:uncharacterized protein (TIGR02118 family)